MTAVALYIDPRGPYPALGVDCYDQTRDARLYDGPHPVVAHPPCGPWGRLRHLYRGNEHDCAPRAVEQVCAFGGVLEHPAGSLLWRELGLPCPGQPADAWGGYTIEVNQVDWGHVARKPTWIYIVGTEKIPPPPLPREPTHWISGFRSSTHRTPEHYKRQGCAVPPGIKVCSAEQRRRTPPAFARWLLDIAEGCAR